MSTPSAVDDKGAKGNKSYKDAQGDQSDKLDVRLVADYALQLGDDALILSQRLAEWCAHSPELEEDVALANLALDLLGQARTLLTYAATLEGRGRSEDDLAFLRTEREFR